MINIATKALYTVAIAMALALSLPAQYSIQSSELIGGSSEDLGQAIATAEGFTAIGSRSSSADMWVDTNRGGTDYWIVQRNPEGVTVWSRTYGGFHNDDLFSIGYADDRIAAFGTTRSTGGDVGNNPGVIGAWLLVTDLTGEPFVSRVYAGTLGEQGIDMDIVDFLLFQQ